MFKNQVLLLIGPNLIKFRQNSVRTFYFQLELDFFRFFLPVYKLIAIKSTKYPNFQRGFIKICSKM